MLQYHQEHELKGARIMSISKELSHREFLQRENDIKHSPYEKELEFYSAVREGDLDTVSRTYTPLAVEGYGRLSDNDVNNVRYHLIITIAMLARFCIEGGMSPETAYTISDIYINKCDKCQSEEGLRDLHREVMLEYARRMKNVSAGQAYSKHVVMCIDLIYDNIYKGVRVGELAEQLGLTPQYLSKLFKKEVGVTISEFIMSKRIQTAENMLKFSEYDPIDIGNFLCFSSHSHFIYCFRKHTGLTPKQYRERYYRSNWSGEGAGMGDER